MKSIITIENKGNNQYEMSTHEYNELTKEKKQTYSETFLKWIRYCFPTKKYDSITKSWTILDEKGKVFSTLESFLDKIERQTSFEINKI
jgi:hypothetical protein